MSRRKGSPDVFCVCLILAALLPAAALARETPPLLVTERNSAGPAADRKVAARPSATADTLDFGFYDSGTGYAVLGESWTFDHGAADPLEGWYAVDVSENAAAHFKRIDAASWIGHFNTVAPPIPSGTGAAWVGAYEDEADDLCWASGLGYGNRWCQRLTGPGLVYTGSGDISLGFVYFNDTEEDFDYTKAILRLGDGTETSLNGVGYTGRIGIPVGGPPTFETSAITIPGAQFAGQTSFQIVFEFASDGGWSDEDGEYATEYGPFAADDITLDGSVSGGPVVYDFESDLQGWTATTCGALGSFFAVHPLSDYTILDFCDCGLSGNVVALHDASGGHPYGQYVQAISPPANRAALGETYNEVLADWDQYSILPRPNGVFYRPGWNYYPYVCPETGETQWSGRTGQDVWHSTGNDPVCSRERNVATDWGVPGSCAFVSFVFEIYTSCDAFGIPPTECTGVTNFTPVLDNVRIRITSTPNAPAVSFEPGCYFQDGFGQSIFLATNNAGNADVTYDLHRDLPSADYLGDSLVIKGPIPTATTKWEARMWWRIPREGPGQASISGYTSWRNAVADGLSIVGPTGQFTFGHMDSMQAGTQVAKHKFISEFREADDDFAGENTNNNEMIRDLILAPGTQVEYFISSNYIGNSESYLLPDTTGKNYLEFEILPSWRMVSGVAKFPCVLTIDLNSGDQRFVEPALNQVLNGAGLHDPIPSPTRWDRYDYNDATSSWNGLLARAPGGNNGVSIWQLWGYRAILLYAGGVGSGAFEPVELELLDEWLRECDHGQPVNRQGLIVNGHNLPARLNALDPAFLSQTMGASVLCESYRDAGCGPTPADDGSCVRIEAANSAEYAPSLEYDVWSNGCPTATAFDVLGTAVNGVGNRVYYDFDGQPPVATAFAQVVNSGMLENPPEDFRTVLDGTSYGSLSTREAGSECAEEFDRIASATAAEIASAFEWIFGSEAAIPQFCEGVYLHTCAGAVPEEPYQVGTAPQLFPATPNPFHPTTMLRYALPAVGEAQLDIYDVAGRRVRRLVDGNRTAGLHEVAWDGSDDRGHILPPGVYWAQLRAGGVTSNKRLVQIK